MLTINKLIKKYNGKIILNEISFAIHKGQVVVLIGPSGSGKSTILRCINNLEGYESGFIDSSGISKTKVGMVFQHFNLFNNMTLIENLTYAPINVLKYDKKDAISIATKWLEMVNLSNFKDAYPWSLSGGQKQRAAIARALCMDPEIILFDEPTSALDPENVKEVLDVIKSLAHTGITMLIVTHAMKFASSIADRVLFLDHGELIEDNNAADFFNSPLTKRARDFLNIVSESSQLFINDRVYP